MATRPIFVPLQSGNRLVETVMIDFLWHPGLSASQKQRSMHELHDAAAARGFTKVLEVSTKSELEIGRRLSAFHQKVPYRGNRVPLECAFQGSKVFENGGPFTDLIDTDPRQAKRDPRLQESGKLVAFEFERMRYPLVPTTSFYDWLYVNAIYPEREWLRRLAQVEAFSDIEFNPERSLNCQARACALFVALEARGLLDEALRSFDDFVRTAYGMELV